MTQQFSLSRAMAAGGRCQTRDGRPARILATDLRNKWPIVAAVEERGKDDVVLYCADGRLWDDSAEHVSDLINIPVKREGWVNIYHSTRADGLECGTVHPTEADAKGCARLVDAIATVKIEWEEMA